MLWPFFEGNQKIFKCPNGFDPTTGQAYQCSYAMNYVNGGPNGQTLGYLTLRGRHSSPLSGRCVRSVLTPSLAHECGSHRIRLFPLRAAAEISATEHAPCPCFSQSTEPLISLTLRVIAGSAAVLECLSEVA